MSTDDPFQQARRQLPEGHPDNQPEEHIVKATIERLEILDAIEQLRHDNAMRQFIIGLCFGLLIGLAVGVFAVL